MNGIIAGREVLKCGNCRFWERLEDTGNTEESDEDLSVGYCRRSLPIGDHHFPKVFNREWCAYFEKIESDEDEEFEPSPDLYNVEVEWPTTNSWGWGGTGFFKDVWSWISRCFRFVKHDKNQCHDQQHSS